MRPRILTSGNGSGVLSHPTVFKRQGDALEHDATERFGARECTGASKNPMDGLWGSTSASAHRKSCNTVWGSASVHWHVEKAYGWFVGVRECIGTSKVLQHGWESASVHWHVENAFGTIWQSASLRHIDLEKPKSFESTRGGRIGRILGAGFRVLIPNGWASAIGI